MRLQQSVRTNVLDAITDLYLAKLRVIHSDFEDMLWPIQYNCLDVKILQCFRLASVITHDARAKKSMQSSIFAQKTRIELFLNK